MRFQKNKTLLLVIVLAFILTSFTTKDVPHTFTTDVQVLPIATKIALAGHSLDADIPVIDYQSSYANRNITLSVMRGRTKEEAYEIVQSTVLSYFDVLESDNESSGYLRTAWVGTNYANNTKRVRVIIRKSGSKPVKFSLKFVSQESGVAGTSYTDDAKYKSINSIPNSYDGFIEELMARLKN